MPRKRRPSPTEQEIDRIAETLFNLDVGKEIQDRDSFDLAFDGYFEEDERMQRNEKVRKKVFKEIKELNPDISDLRLFKKAGGKSLKRDRRQTAKHIVKTKKAYIKKGSRRVDLAGYDVKKKRVLKIVGRVRGRIVYTSRETVKVKGKSLIRHRDKIGRFASIKRKRR